MEYTVVCLQGCCSSPLSGAFTPPALVVVELVFSSPRCAPCLQQENSHLSVQSRVPRKQVRTQLTLFAAPLLWWLFHSTKLVTDVLWVQEISISEASSMKLATGLRSRSGNSLYSPFPSSGRRGGSPIPRVSRGSAWLAGAASGTTVPLADGGWRAGFSSRGGSRKSFGSSAFPAASPEGSSSNKESRGLALYWISCISEGKTNSSKCFTNWRLLFKARKPGEVASNLVHYRKAQAGLGQTPHPRAVRVKPMPLCLETSVPGGHSKPWLSLQWKPEQLCLWGITACAGDTATRALADLLPTVALLSRFHMKRDTGWDPCFLCEKPQGTGWAFKDWGTASRSVKHQSPHKKLKPRPKKEILQATTIPFQYTVCKETGAATELSVPSCPPLLPAVSLSLAPRPSVLSAKFAIWNKADRELWQDV